MSNPLSSEEDAIGASNDREEKSYPDGTSKTPIIRRESGEVVGVSLFLTADDLASLGVNVKSEEDLYYQITDCGYIQINNIPEDLNLE